MTAAAIESGNTTRRVGVPVAHVEDGIRSEDNLRTFGIPEERVFSVGNTMIDTLLASLERLRRPKWWAAEGLETGEYELLTMHGPSIFHGLAHPRTEQTLDQTARLPANLRPMAPQPYLKFNVPVQHARAVITNPEGIAEEAKDLRVLYITLRDSPGRVERGDVGQNELVGADPERVRPAPRGTFASDWKRVEIPPLRDDHTGERNEEHLDRLGQEV